MCHRTGLDRSGWLGFSSCTDFYTRMRVLFFFLTYKNDLDMN